jgi:glutamyl-tRNA synthetase
MEEVRVRFAPSPTGFLHVGGARTAIFNWLFAKNRNGKFLLRIEDTDPGRSKSELTEQIIRSLSWLGMDSDEPIVYQSDRLDRYKEIVMKLVEEKKAYYAFETYEELEAKRKESESKNIYYKYDRASLKYDEETVNKFLKEGKPYSVRFLVPDGVTEFNDIIHGSTSVQNSEIDDFVIMRTDGTPTYQLAVVVDDHDMNITHIIRGDDHLSNTPKQILIYNVLAWKVPELAHLPLIIDESKKKLSKRRENVSVEEYNELGYLPEALFNFLTLLGFAPSDNREIISRDELVRIFSLERVNKKPAVFDTNKLNWLNFEYIKTADEKRLAELIKEKLVSEKIIDEKTNFTTDRKEITSGYILKMIPLMKERVTTINGFIDKGKYFFFEPDSYDEQGLAKYWNEESKKLLTEYLEILKQTAKEKFTTSSLEEHLRSFAEAKSVKAGKIIHPLRLALTGTTKSPGIFELMEVLGKTTTENRIERLLKS